MISLIPKAGRYFVYRGRALLGIYLSKPRGADGLPGGRRMSALSRDMAVRADRCQPNGEADDYADLDLLDRAVVKAIARRLDRIGQEHAFAAHMDAGFDAGEFSGPAHDRMWEDAREGLLSRFSPEQRRQITEEEFRRHHADDYPMRPENLQ